MKTAQFYALTFLVVLLFVDISIASMAEVATVKIEISDVVSNTDARQIRRLLEPWEDPKDLTFCNPLTQMAENVIYPYL